MTKVLITGGSGLLAKYLSKTQPKEYEVELTWYSNFMHGLTMYHLDIASQSQVDYVFSRVKPDIVIHAAAIGSVDYAENHFRETHLVNVLGTKYITNACRNFKAKLVYISTNAVFDGKNPPYDEKSERHPINGYGIMKKEAEQHVLDSENWIIARPFLLYGWPYPGGRENWFTTILKNLAIDKKTKLVNDIYWQPTLAEDCATTIWKLIEIDKWGEIYHVASDDKMTLFDFGLKVAQIAEKDSLLIQPVASDILKIAPRPKDTTFDLTKIHNLGLYPRNVEEGLRVLKNEN